MPAAPRAGRIDGSWKLGLPTEPGHLHLCRTTKAISPRGGHNPWATPDIYLSDKEEAGQGRGNRAPGTLPGYSSLG